MSSNNQKIPKSAVVSERLLTEFSAPAYEEWRAAVDKLLKGKPYDKIMLTQTFEGIELQPLYRREDIENLAHIESRPGFRPYVRGKNALGFKAKPWLAAQEIPYPTYQELNEALHRDLAKGETAINMVLDRSTCCGLDPDRAKTGDVGAAGTSIASVTDMSKALAGIDLKEYPVYIQAGSSALVMAAILGAMMRKQGQDLHELRGAIALDPIGILALEGTLPVSLAGAYREMECLTKWAIEQSLQLQTIGVDVQPYHNGGASAVQELAFALATGLEYLREMIRCGFSIDDVAPRIRFTFALGSNFFMEIAKLRAAKMTWANVVKEFRGSEESQKMTTHGRTSRWNKTIFDPYINMLRTTTEAFSGVVGGCDSLHIGAFDEILGLPNEFSRRNARNIQFILQKESHLDQVIDPAGGSWYVESLTESVAKEAWNLFQAVERQGGMFKALQQGFPQEQVIGTRERQFRNLAKRKDVIVGTNMYANPAENRMTNRQPDYEAIHRERTEHLQEFRSSSDRVTVKKVLGKLSGILHGSPDQIMENVIEAAFLGATVGEISQTLRANDGDKPSIESVEQHRRAEWFESLRAATEAYIENTGRRPRVFLANMGPVSEHKNPADFATGFFQVGGFEVLSNPGFKTLEAAAKAASESTAPIIVICSTDPACPDTVPRLTRQIKSQKPGKTVVVVGHPRDYIDTLKAAGVDEFIYSGVNMLVILVKLLQKAGVDLPAEHDVNR